MTILFCVAFVCATAVLLRARQAHWRVALAGVLLSGLVIVPATARNTAYAAGAAITLENPNIVPFPDRLVFNRIQQGCTTNPNVNPDFGTTREYAAVRVKNTGSAPLTITALNIVGPWTLDPGITPPATVAVNGSLDVRLRYTATGTFAERKRIDNGTLTIVSNADNGNVVVQLAGFWQFYNECASEPSLQQIVDVFGYKTNVGLNGNYGYGNEGRIERAGDEVLSPYWRRADTSKAVRVVQLAAFHKDDPERVYWYSKGSSSAGLLLTHDATTAQSMLPRKSGSSELAATEFTPTGSVFGFRVAGGIWSDPAKNDPKWDYYDRATNEADKGCQGACGHHMRFWPAKDRSGAIIANTWIMAMDYPSEYINYDYQDNVYLISNMTPEDASAQVLYRMDTGVNRTSYGSNFVDASGNVWTPDRYDYTLTFQEQINASPGCTEKVACPQTKVFFTPVDAIPEGNNGDAIDGTSDDVLYRTYRGNVGNVPQDQRVLTYNLPTSYARNVKLRLHFAERFWTQSGKRLFDVTAEGATILDDFDIFAAAGGKNKALVREFNVAVSDGTLNLVFSASADYPAISGIEVFALSASLDLTPPAQPSSLTATPSASGIQLNWNDNTEGDFNQYKVYRSTSANSGFTVIADNLTTSAFNDTNAPKGVVSHYRVTALDTTGNESAPAAASATRPGDGTPPPPPPTNRKMYLPFVRK